MSRPRGGLNLYLCHDIRCIDEPRLIVARSFEQADSMVPPGWATKLASVMEAYRFGKIQVPLEYYNPKAKETS